MNEGFDNELNHLRQHFKQMGSNVNDLIDASTKSYHDHNTLEARKIVEDEDKTNTEEIKLEKQAMKIMALQQPVATDFRVIISVLKASTDLARIGDHAEEIARETIRAKGNPRITEVEDLIANMTKRIRKMLEQILEAYFNNDDRDALKIAKEDNTIDKFYHKTREIITEEVKKNPETVQAASSYLMVIRLLERIGDHVVNLAEWIIYSKTGKRVELSLHHNDFDPEIEEKK